MPCIGFPEISLHGEVAERDLVAADPPSYERALTPPSPPLLELDPAQMYGDFDVAASVAVLEVREQDLTPPMLPIRDDEHGSHGNLNEESVLVDRGPPPPYDHEQGTWWRRLWWSVTRENTICFFTVLGAWAQLGTCVISWKLLNIKRNESGVVAE